MTSKERELMKERIRLNGPPMSISGFNIRENFINWCTVHDIVKELETEDRLYKEKFGGY